MRDGLHTYIHVYTSLKLVLNKVHIFTILYGYTRHFTHAHKEYRLSARHKKINLFSTKIRLLKPFQLTAFLTLYTQKMDKSVKTYMCLIKNEV